MAEESGLLGYDCDTGLAVRFVSNGCGPFVSCGQDSLLSGLILERVRSGYKQEVFIGIACCLGEMKGQITEKF